MSGLPSPGWLAAGETMTQKQCTTWKLWKTYGKPMETAPSKLTSIDYVPSWPQTLVPNWSLTLFTRSLLILYHSIPCVLLIPDFLHLTSLEDPCARVLFGPCMCVCVSCPHVCVCVCVSMCPVWSLAFAILELLSPNWQRSKEFMTQTMVCFEATSAGRSYAT